MVSFGGSLSDLAGHPPGFLDERSKFIDAVRVDPGRLLQVGGGPLGVFQSIAPASGMLARQRAIQPCVRVRSTIALGSVCMRFLQTASASS